MATATTEPVRLPPGPRIPKPVQGIAFLASTEMFAALGRRYGSAISVNLPVLGHAVVISDPVLVKDVFSTSTDLIERPTSGAGSMGDVFGPGSTVQPCRRGTPRAPQIGGPAVSRQAGAKLRAHRRRGGDARDRDLAGGPRVRNAAADAAHHPRRDPACRVRRRGTRAGRASRLGAAHGRAWRPSLAGAAEDAA